MKPSARQIIADRAAATTRLEAGAPALRKGFADMIAAYYAPGDLDARGKELAAVACSLATVSLPSLAVHIANALAAGASRQQVIEAAAVGVEFGGGPAYSLARDHLLDFVDELESAARTPRP